MQRIDQPEIEFSFPDLRTLSLSACRASEADFRNQPAVALLYAVSGVVLEILGPLFWLALVALFLRAELFPG